MGIHSFYLFYGIAFGIMSTINISFRGNIFLVEGTAGRDDKRLLEKFMNDSDPNVRPVKNIEDQVNVTFDITLHGVIEMDEKHQILSTSVWIRQEWTNHFLKWNPADYGGLKQVVVDSSQIWQPDIVLYNNVLEDFHGRMDNVKTRIRVQHNGHCYWAAPFVFKSSCRVDVADFPFDKQQCKLKFGSWLLDTSQLDLTRKKDSSPVGKDLVSNGEWNVTSVHIRTHALHYACCPNKTYSDITFTIWLQRNSLFYVFNLIIPNFLIALLAFFSLYIPVECGERISFVITVLLSMTVFLLLVAESIPPTSDAIPVIGIYFTGSIIEVALALVATGISLKVHYSYFYGSGLSPRLRRFLFHYLAPVLCIDTSMAVTGFEVKKKKSRNLSKRILRVFKKDRRMDDPLQTDTALLSIDVKFRSEFAGGMEEPQVNQGDTSSKPQGTNSPVVKEKDREKHVVECRIAAAVIDRAFLVLFVSVFVIFTTTVLCVPWIRAPRVTEEFA